MSVTPTEVNGTSRSTGIMPAVTNENDEKSDQGQSACSICLEPTSKGGPPWHLQQPCGHSFHKACLRDLLEHDPRNRCPLCRAPIGSNDFLQICGSSREQFHRTRVARSVARSQGTSEGPELPDRLPGLEMSDESRDRVTALEELYARAEPSIVEFDHRRHVSAYLAEVERERRMQQRVLQSGGPMSRVLPVSRTSIFSRHDASPQPTSFPAAGGEPNTEPPGAVPRPHGLQQRITGLSNLLGVPAHHASNVPEPNRNRGPIEVPLSTAHEDIDAIFSRIEAAYRLPNQPVLRPDFEAMRPSSKAEEVQQLVEAMQLSWQSFLYGEDRGRGHGSHNARGS